MQSPIPMLINSLNALSRVLKTGEAHCTEKGIDPSVLLTARLFPDMLNLISNVRIASDTAKGAAARLTGTENPSFSDEETSFDDLQARIAKTIEYLGTVDEAGFADADAREVILPAGGQEFKFTGAAYLMTFVTPNFYFHATTVYNILRHNGVELGKRDFLNA